MKQETETLCQGERLSDKEIDAFLLGVNNVYRIVYQLRSDLNESHRLLRLTLEHAVNGEAVDVGQIKAHLERKW